MLWYHHAMPYYDLSIITNIQWTESDGEAQLSSYSQNSSLVSSSDKAWCSAVWVWKTFYVSAHIWVRQTPNMQMKKIKISFLLSF